MNEDRATTVVRDREAPFSSFAELSPDGILINAGGRFVYANPAAARILGADHPEQILGRSPFDLLLPEYHQRTRERIARVLTGETSPLAETAWRRLDGSVVITEVTAGPISWEGEQAVQVLVRDITEKKRAEEELAAEKTYAESIVETLHEPLLVLTRDLRVRSANPAFYDHFEVRRDETEGQLIYLLGNGQWDIPKLRELLDDVLPDSNVFNDYEVSHDFEDIGHRVMLLNARRLDHVQLILLGIRDITEKKRAEEELRRRGEQFESLIHQAPIGVYLIDGDFRLAQVNPVAQPVFGDVSDLIGRDFDEVIHILWEKSYADEVTQLFRRTLETGEPYETPERAEFRADRGVVEYYSWRIDRITLPDGRYGVVCYFSDISELVRVREMIAESERKYRTLFESIDEGFCTFDMIFDDAGAPVDYRFVEHNPAFERHAGFKDVAGRTVREFLPDQDRQWFEIYGRVAMTGEPVRVMRYGEALKRWIEVYAFRIGEPKQRRVAALFSDITARKEAELALQASEERQAFLLGLTDALRPLTEPHEVQMTTTKLLAEQLDLMRATYFEVEADQDRIALTARWERDAAPIPDRLRLSDFAPELSDAYRSGRTLALRDTETETQWGSRPESYRSLGIRAWVGVPLVKDGQLVAILGLHSATPRDWTDSELRLVEDVAERTWAAVERARAEGALRDLNATLEQRVEKRTEELRRSEQRFSAAFHAAPFAACITSLPEDRFLEVNSVFERLTGYSHAEAIGRTSNALKLWSSKEDRALIEKSGSRGAFRDLELSISTKAGEPRIILCSSEPIGSGSDGLLIKMFYDITERKRTEEQLRGALELVMQDTAWFSQAVMERLAHVRAGKRERLESVDLTKRERQVLVLVAQGKSNPEIAAELGIAQQTVRNYITTVYEKTGVRSRAAAVVWARERGLVSY